VILRQVIAATVVAIATATAADTVTPSTPTGLRQIGQEQGQAVYGWEASTDDVGVTWYSIKLDGSMVRKATKRTMRVYDLYLYCHAQPGHSYTLTIEAVDAAGNHSAPSEGVLITVA
jgi:cellulose 1,4-beta-cellobiosidase